MEVRIFSRAPSNTVSVSVPCFFIILDAAKKGEENHDLKTEDKKSSLQADSQKKTVNKALSLFYLLLRISVIGILIAQFFNGNFENVMLCVLTLILFAIPPLIERETQNRDSGYAGSDYPSIYLCRRNPRRDPFLLYCVSGLGHDASYDQRFSLRCHRFFADRHPQPQRSL